MGLCLVLAVGIAQGQLSAASHRPPIVGVVMSEEQLKGPPPPEPPRHKSEALVDDPASDLYACGNGLAVHYAAEYRAFEAKHRPPNVDETTQYVAARKQNLPLPPLPPSGRAPGYVMLRVAIGADGRVHDVFVACSTDSYLNDIAAATVESATFTPASSRGQPVPSVESIEYWFMRQWSSMPAGS
jgi:outer membrane biosynthesis protein TonB